MSSRALEAIPILNDLIRAERENVALIIDKGTALVAVGKYSEAIDCFDYAERMDPNSFNEATLNANKGYALFKLNQHSDALKCYTKAIELRPNDHSYYDNRALALYSNRHFKEALADFQTSITLKPTYRPFLYSGIISKILDDPQEAINYFEKALVVKPDDARAIDLIISVMLSQNMFEDSLLYIDKALRHRPNDATLLQKKGMVLCSLKRNKEGISMLEQAIKADHTKEKEIRELINVIDE
jgi:tetratricopeptide (TPR) repeat protein